MGNSKSSLDFKNDGRLYVWWNVWMSLLYVFFFLLKWMNCSVSSPVLDWLWGLCFELTGVRAMKNSSSEELDSYYPVRPECLADVPKTRFKARVCWKNITFFPFSMLLHYVWFCSLLFLFIWCVIFILTEVKCVFFPFHWFFDINVSRLV